MDYVVPSFLQGGGLRTYAAVTDNISGRMSSSGSARPEDVRKGETIVVNDELVEGSVEDATVKVKNASSVPEGKAITPLSAGKIASIKAGTYVNEDINIAIASLADMTGGTASNVDILDGKTAWVNGQLMTGTIKTTSANKTSLDAGETATIAKGYVAQDIKVTAQSNKSIVNALKQKYADQFTTLQENATNQQVADCILNSNLGGKIKSFATYRSDNSQHNYPAYSLYYLKDGTKEININVTSNSGNSFYQVQTPSQIIINETNLSIGNNKITIPGNYNNVILVIKNKTSGGQCNYSIE